MEDQYTPQTPQPEYQPQYQQSQPQYQQPIYQQPQYQQPVYQQPQAPAAPVSRKNGAGGVGFAFGLVTLIFTLLVFISLDNDLSSVILALVSLIFACIFSIPALICSIVGLAKRNAPKALAAVGMAFTVASGIIIAIIGEGLDRLF